MESPALRELQTSFFGFVAGPVEATWDARGSAVRGAVRGDTVLTAEDRLGIYRGMCLARLVDVLRDDFADVADAWGTSAFDATARSYVIENPSEMPSIQHVSDRFPEFLEAVLEDRPDLAERAAIDRARLEVFSETDPTALTLERLRAAPAQEWGSLALTPIAALRVITRAWSADDGPVRPKPHVTRVWRQGFEIFQATVDVTEAGALDLLQAGGTTLEGLALFLASGRPEEEAARQSGALLLRWLEDGILEDSGEKEV
jgi:hypothetical protein